MLNRFIKTTVNFFQQWRSSSTAWIVFVRSTLQGFLTTAHHALMILGVFVLIVAGILFIKPNLLDHVKVLLPVTAEVAEEESLAQSPLTNLTVTSPPQVDKQGINTDTIASKEVNKPSTPPLQQRWVINWLSKRYRVAEDATHMLVSAAYGTAREINLDPLLILAVMAIESGFNPFAESPVGAQGLMQVMSKVHHEKFQDLGGIKAALNPIANIKVGSLILKDYMTRGGSVEAGLKLYVGAALSGTDSGYGTRVLAEYQRLRDVSTGKNVPIFSATVPLAPQKPRQQIQADEQKINTPIPTEVESVPVHQEPMPADTRQVAGL